MAKEYKVSQLALVGEKYFTFDGRSDRDSFDYKSTGEFKEMVDTLPFEIVCVWGTFVVLDADIWTAITGKTNPVKGDVVYFLSKDTAAYEVDRLEFNPQGDFSFDHHVADTIADERNAAHRYEHLVFQTSFDHHNDIQSFGFEVCIIIGNNKTLYQNSSRPDGQLVTNINAFVVNIDTLGEHWQQPSTLISLSHSFY